MPEKRKSSWRSLSAPKKLSTNGTAQPKSTPEAENEQMQSFFEPTKAQVKVVETNLLMGSKLMTKSSSTSSSSSTPSAPSTDLHSELIPLFLREVATVLKNKKDEETKANLFTEVVLDPINARWLIFRHEAGWYLEVQGETTSELLLLFGDGRGRIEVGNVVFERSITALIPGSSNRTDILVSLKYPNKTSLAKPQSKGAKLPLQIIPLWVIDLKFEATISNFHSQILQYALDGLMHNMRVSPRPWEIRASLWNYERMGPNAILQMCTWNVRREPNKFQVTRQPIAPNPLPADLAKHVCDWGLAQGAILFPKQDPHKPKQHISLATSDPLPSDVVMWFSEDELNLWLQSDEKLPEGIAPCKFCPDHSLRHSIYESKGWFLKLLPRYDPHFEVSVEANQTLIAYAQAELTKLHASLATMIPEHKWWRISPQFFLLASKNVGPTGLSELCSQSDEVLRNFMFRMLALTQLPPSLEPPQAICHGDLRGANVTLQGQVIDFEFLGLEDPRKEGPEISFRLARGYDLTVCDTAWQLAILLVEALDIGGWERAAALKQTRFERQTTPFLIEFKSPLDEFWRRSIQTIVTEFGDLDTYYGRNEGTLADKCKAYFMMFHPDHFVKDLNTNFPSKK